MQLYSPIREVLSHFLDGSVVAGMNADVNLVDVTAA